MRKQLFILFSLLVGFVPAVADNITVGGTQRSYIVYAPRNLGQNRPLLISCHGMNQDANYQKCMLAIESVADTAKFLTVFPEGIDKSWDISGDRDINFITALITAMVNKYQIDRNRVYLSGFSMGGMFTYHAMNKIADKIAAFAPISGYPMWGTTANSNVRPIPIIHTHGTSDDVVDFGGVQGALNVWIRHNGCPTTPKVTQNYRGASHITRRVWGPGNEGVEVVLMEMAGKGHWISNDNGVKTGDEIWRFCKRFTLDKSTNPQVGITAPKSGLTFTCFAPEGEAIFPDITVSATAFDVNGTVQKVDFYDGATLVATDNESPYETVVAHLAPGIHKLKAVATDNDGEVGADSVMVTLDAPQTCDFSKAFNEGGCVPAGWVTQDSKEQRVGYANGFTQGCRVLRFTGATRAFDYGLYFRNIGGKKHQGWAKYGLVSTDNTLTLTPGHYTLRYQICNWNNPEFSPVEIVVQRRDNFQTVATQTYTPDVNIGNVFTNSFGPVEQQTLEFDIAEQADIVFTFYTAAAEWADCIIGQLSLTADSYNPTGITDAVQRSTLNVQRVYDLQGRRVVSPVRAGLYVSNGKKVMVR